MSGGRRGGGSGSGILQVANVLGIQRHELSTYGAGSSGLTQQPISYQAYPPMDIKPLPIPDSAELQYLADVNEELIRRFQEAPFYVPDKGGAKDINRYTDKYRKTSRVKWEPDLTRLPAELHMSQPSTAVQPKTKKPRLSGNVISRLEQLERSESSGERKSASKSSSDKPEDTSIGGGESDKSDTEEKPMAEAEQEMSDEDYLEEDNDYAVSYFDNGEDYDNDSGDNLDEDAVF